jgi:hypothetical protein
MSDKKGFRYLGPTEFFIYKERAYRPGDEVPLNEDEMNHHRVYGSAQFEGFEPAFTAPVTARPEDALPFDDMGRPMLLGPEGQVLRQGTPAYDKAMAKAQDQAVAAPVAAPVAAVAVAKG